MRLPLLTSLALFVAAPAHAVLALAHVGPVADRGVWAVEVATAGTLVGQGQVLHHAERSAGLSFGDSAQPSSPADDHLAGVDTWRSGAGNQRDGVLSGAHNITGHSVNGSVYGSAMAEPAGWAVVAAALLTLAGLLGLRHRTR